MNPLGSFKPVGTVMRHAASEHMATSGRFSAQVTNIVLV
jgi:hypothetical protein